RGALPRTLCPYTTLFRSRVGGDGLRSKKTCVSAILMLFVRVARLAGAAHCDSCGEEPEMTYVVTESCIRCKYTDCVDVCPVDCLDRKSTRLNSSHVKSSY